MITKIHIKNFRSIKDASINLGTLNVLVGANGAGKSTLLEALNFTKRIVAGSTVSEAALGYAPFGPDFFNFYSDGNIAEFDFEVQTKENNIFAYHFSIGYNPDLSSQEEFYVYSEKLGRVNKDDGSTVNIFDRNTGSNRINIEANGKTDRLPIDIENNRLFLATLSHPSTKEIVETISSYEIIWADDRLENSMTQKMIVDSPTSTATVDDVAVALSIKDRSRFDAAVSTIQKIIPEFTAPRIHDLTATMYESDKASGSSSKRTEAKEKKGYRYMVSWVDSRHRDTIYSRFSISGGNTRVIYLILSLYNTESKSCFVAEEIENGMHPGRVRKLVQVLVSIAKDRKIQLIFSTHSHLLTSEVLPRDVVFCKYVEGEGSVYQKLSDTDQYALIKEALDTEPSTDEVLNSGLLFGD